MSDVDEVVVEEIAFGDLTGIKEVKDVLPASSGVRVRIDKATIKDNSYEGSVPTKKYLNLQLRLVDGVAFTDEAGEAQVKYKNKVVFTSNKDLVVWVDKNHEFYKAEKYKKDSFLIPLRTLWLAVGKDPKNVTINKEELESLKGIELECNITHKEKRVKGPDGDWIGSGEFENGFSGWKQA